MPLTNEQVERESGTQISSIKDTKKTCVVISDPAIIKIILDDKRRAILRVLRNGVVDKPVENDDEEPVRRYEMTAIEMVEQLNNKGLDIKKSAVYFHLDKLEEAGLIEVARKEQKKRSMITYYRRTAPIFLISYHDAPEVKEEIKKSKDKGYRKYIELFIKAFGKENSENKEEIVQALDELYSCYEEAQLEISNKMIGEIPDNKALKVFQGAIDIKLAADEKYHEHAKKITKLLFD
ncbi:MAG: winged helix-turn-helix domain-containing protein [Candidatus Hodarchaeales archaeon]